MRTLKWFLMLNKRLYKKASFIAILILVPLCVMLFASASKQDKGFLHIILVQTESRDKVSSEIIDDFMNKLVNSFGENRGILHSLLPVHK